MTGAGRAARSAGHTVFDLATGEVIFSAGPSGFFDRDLAALCDALRRWTARPARQ